MPSNQTTFKKGHIRSIESRLKQSETMRGRINPLSIKKMNTPESNAKKGHKGSKHPMWIKDRSLLKDKRHPAEMKWWRKSVFKRDDYTCQFCKVRGGELQADHIKSYSLYPKLRFNLSNGRTLCRECHKKTDTYGHRSWVKLNQNAVQIA